MPLRIIIKPQERLIINGAVLRNGGSHNVSLIVETQCQFLRESELIDEDDADTPCKQLCLTLQALYFSNDPTKTEALVFEQSVKVLREVPNSAPILLKIQEAMAAKEIYQAVKIGKQLVALEHELHAASSTKSVA